MAELKPLLEKEGVKLHPQLFRPANCIETAGRNVVDISMGAETSFSANGFVTSGFSASDVIKITGDADSESITGSAIADVILGKGGSDIIAGGAGNDRLDGGSGADFMFGGAGDDTYVIDNAGDKAAEILLGADPGGTDIVLSSVTTTLTGFIENLTLTGAAAIDGTGNGLANQITGNSGANSLTGGAGADVLRGGGGNDLFVYNSTADSGVGGGGVRDIIKDFAPGDRIDVSAIDANELLNLNQAFQLDTDGIFTAGEFRFTEANGNTIIAFNTDGDATPEMQILVQNVTTMTAADLIL